jgi:hypothetical protein
MNIFLTFLATFYVTYCLVKMDGPFVIFYRLRTYKALGALECMICTSIYVGGLLSILSAHSVQECLLLALASAGLTTLIYLVFDI